MEKRSGELGESLGEGSSDGYGLGVSPSRAPIDQLQTSLWRLEEELREWARSSNAQAPKRYQTGDGEADPGSISDGDLRNRYI